MTGHSDGEDNAGSRSVAAVPAAAATSDGSPDLVAWVRRTLESPEERPGRVSSSAEDDAGQRTTAVAGSERTTVEDQPEPSGTSLIYVEYSTPAVLNYSETATIHRNLREAIIAWLALPNGIKKSASITTGQNGEARYQGWEIYRLWERSDS
jgi:hypothetical protein